MCVSLCDDYVGNTEICLQSRLATGERLSERVTECGDLSRRLSMRDLVIH